MLRFVLITLLTGLSVPIAPTIASATGACCCFCRAGRCSVKIDKQDVEATVFKVECETVCIPPIRFPWECGPLRRCGQVRVIKKLVTDKEKHTECTYEWSGIACCPQCSHRIKCRPACPPACEPACPVPVPCPGGVDQPTYPQPSSLDNACDPVALQAGRTAALTSAIARSAPQEDGWVVIDPGQQPGLSSYAGLIDTAVEIVDSQARRR